MSSTSTRPQLQVAVRDIVIGLVVMVVLGALAGVVWEWVWTPPAGIAFDHAWVPRDEAAARGVFTATGWFVVVATTTGVIGGALLALLLDRQPLATLATVVLGSVLATLAMALVGTALGPDDPDVLARTAKNGTRLPGSLDVVGAGPWVALTAAALVVTALVFFGLSSRPGPERADGG